MQNKIKNASQVKNSNLRARVTHETRRQIFCYLGMVGIALSLMISCVGSGGSGSGSAFGNYAAIGYNISLETFKRYYEEIKSNPGDVK